MKTNIGFINIFCIFLAFFLISCSPSTQMVQTAIALTEAATSQTETIKPIATSEFTKTSIPEPSSTPTIKPTPDLRIIDTDPQKLLCQKEDLPKEGKYYIPDSTWMSINTNEEVISNRGVEEGRQYVTDTGRVTGWWADRLRGTRAVILPDEIMCGVYMYKTNEGALKALNTYNSLETDHDNNWKYLPDSKTLGVENNIIVLYKTDSGGDKNTSYDLEFVYKNMMGQVFAYSKKDTDISPAVIEEIAAKMLAKLKAEPLVNPEDAVLTK
jgi:hypothetical protein